MKLRPFEIALVAIFGTLLILALLLLRTYTPAPDPNESQIGSLTIWGVLPADAFEALIREIGFTDPGFKNVNYRFIDSADFDNKFVNALADQEAPDLILIGHDRIAEHRSRLQTISYDSFPLRDYRTSYIDGAEIFALSDGIVALPLAVDPLVMYWNRDIFADQGFSVAPKTWEELVGTYVPALTVRDNSRNIVRAGIALGEYRNIENAFPILSLLLLQAGSVMVTENGFNYNVSLNESSAKNTTKPLVSAVTFYTNFNNTSNTLYSWNRALRSDKDMFLSEDLAIYFGFASEGKALAAKNPNLSFDVAVVLQGAAANVKRTYGAFYGLAIPKASRNKNGAGIVMNVLGSANNTKFLADKYDMAPIYRGSLSQGSDGVYSRVAYDSALSARGWLNPDRDRLDNLLIEMLEGVSANRSNLSKSTSDALVKISQIY